MGDNSLGSKSVCQIGIVVRDIERSVQKYAEVFGVEPPPIILTEPQEKAHSRFRGNPTPAQARLAFLPLGQVTLELIEPVGGPSTWREFLDERGEGVHHIAFEIKDMETVVRQLAGHDIGVIQSGDYTGGRYAYLDSSPALGTIIELLENF